MTNAVRFPDQVDIFIVCVMAESCSFETYNSVPTIAERHVHASMMGQASVDQALTNQTPNAQ